MAGKVNKVECWTCVHVFILTPFLIWCLFIFYHAFFLKDDALDHRGQHHHQSAFQAGGVVSRGEQGGPQPVLAVAHFAPGMMLFIF